MGDYVTGAEVYDLLINNTMGDPPRITTTQVEEFIAGVEGQINGVLLARGYSPIPAVHTGAVAVIREKVRRKCAADVFDALNQIPKSPDFVRTWHIDFAEWLNRLRLGQELLPGGVVNPLGDAVLTSFNLGLTEVEEET